MELKKIRQLWVLALFIHGSVALALGQNPQSTNDSCNTFLAVGQHRILNGGGYLDFSQFSKNGKQILSVTTPLSESTHSTLVINGVGPTSLSYVVDPFSHRNYPGLRIQISESGDWAAFIPPAKYQSHPVIYDVKQNKMIHLPEFEHATSVEFSTDSKFIFATLSDHSFGIYNVESQSFHSLNLFQGKWSIQTLGSSHHVLVTPTHGYSRWIDLETQEVQIIKTNQKVVDIQSSQDGTRLVLKSGLGADSELTLFDGKNKITETLDLKDTKSLQLSSDGKDLFFSEASSPNRLKKIALSSKQQTVLAEDYGMGMSLSSNGLQLLYRRTDQGLNVIQLQTQKTSKFLEGTQVLEFSFLDSQSHVAQVQYSSNEHLYLSTWDTQTGKITPYEIPFDGAAQLSGDGKHALFNFPNQSAFRGGTHTLYDLTEISDLIKSGQVLRGRSESYFRKLAVPGAFHLKEHAQEVFYFFESGLFRTNKKTAEKILLNVLNKSAGMFEAIVDRYPEFAAETYFFDEKMVEAVDPIWNRAIEKYLDYFVVTRANAKSIVESMKYLKAIHNYTGNLKNWKMNEYADAVTEALADAAINEEFHGIFKSMLYKFCEEYTNPIFWIPLHPMTDISFIRKPFQLEPIVFGTRPISGDLKTKTKFGFYAQRLEPVKVSEAAKAGDPVLTDHKVKWTQDEKHYEATLNIDVIAKSIEPVTPHLRKLNYRELWKDKKLTGMIIVGSNLAAEAGSTIIEYEKYFNRAGFKFEEHATITKDLKTYFENSITGGELDYFIKEAHSDGDERNIFRINYRARIMKATRKMKNGFDEVMYLVFPTEKLADYTDPTKTVQITNEEFGQWIRNRESAGKGQFVFFNESCWSVSKAINEIEEAYSKTLVEIPSTLPVNMFEDRADNAAAILLTDFRAGKILFQIEKDMRRNADFAHQIGNTFIFPYSKEYQELIRDVLKPPTRIRVVVTQDGKIYSRDE